MADFLLMVVEDEGAHASQSPKAMAELIDRREAFVDGLRRTGVHRDGGRLRPSKEGKRVRRDAGGLHVESGPFAGDGKALAGYCWVQAPGIDQAAAVAEGLPTLPTDEVDVRPLMKGNVDADKDGKPGKIFAFAVLGSAPTEAAWVKVMDRIDAETQAGFPVGPSLGGVRLEPPGAGKRVVRRGERHATLDGPFLESKEVIGGLFFLRMASLDEAVRWASASPFVVHGALEIRELWRT